MRLYAATMILPLSAYALGVAALTFAEVRGDTLWQRGLKPLLAIAFVVAALSASIGPEYGDTQNAVGTSGAYTTYLIIGLAACAAGDILLLRRGTGTAFQAGMAAFGIGHILFILAFVSLGVEYRFGLAILVLGLFVGVAQPLIRTVGPEMRWPVTAYAAIIIAMVGAAWMTATWLILPAAAFAASDVFVARNRFAEPEPWHPLAITPLYFGAQMAFALSPLFLA